MRAWIWQLFQKIYGLLKEENIISLRIHSQKQMNSAELFIW